MPFIPRLSKQSPSSKKGNIYKHKHTNSISSAEDCTNFLIAGLAAGSAPATESESTAESAAESAAKSAQKRALILSVDIL
jgi:hypothetical protein